MAKLKKLLFTGLFLFLVFFGFDYYKLHTESDVIAAKRFSKAVLNQDDYVLRMTSTPEVSSAAFKSNGKRFELFRDLRIRFTYHTIKSRFINPEGTKSEIIMEQVSRVSRRGNHIPWGDGEVRLYQKAKLEKQNSIWRVVSYEDPAMRR